MAFTKEEIDQFIKGLHNYQQEEIKKSPNYNGIIEYVTGATTSLSIISRDYLLREFSFFPQLLQSIEHPTAKDKLVLDVLSHPDVFGYTNLYTYPWFIQYCVTKNTEAALQAV